MICVQPVALLCSLWILLLCRQTLAATVLFTEEDRSALESEITDIDLELLQLSTEPVDVRVFPVTMDEFKNSYASSMNIDPADQRAIDAIADPAEYDPNPDGKRDFNKINITVTFNPGDLTKTITSANLLIDDNINEAEEAFLLLLEIVDSGSNETVIQDVLIFRIRNDDELIVGFEQTTYTFSENAGNLTDEIRIVKINNVTSEVNQTLILSSEDGSAKKGDDYLTETTSIIFPAGDQNVAVPITILSSPGTEPDETFTLSISTTGGNIRTGVATIMPSTTVITIIEENGSPTMLIATDDDKDSLPAGAIVGIVLAVIIFIVLLILCVVLLLILCYCCCYSPMRQRRGPVVAHDAYINEWNTILVDMSDCDIKDGKLDVDVTGPSGYKTDIQVEIEYCSDDGESDDKERAIVKYLPTVLGKHTISIFWRHSQIRNSPSIVTVKERPRVEVVGEGSMEAVVGIWNQFEVDMRQNKQGKLEVFITGPGKPDININKQSNGIALVKYLPSVSGEYYITVLVDGALILGCPIKPTFRGTYPTAHIGGNGIPPTGKAGKWSTFEVVMRGASESNISVEIHGPSKPEVDVNYHSSESATVRYCLEQPGEYYITVLFNNQPINGCPFKTVIAPTEQAIQQNGWGMGVEVVVVGNDIEMDTIGGDNATL